MQEIRGRCLDTQLYPSLGLQASGIVVGQGYRFGYKQSGDAELLRSLGEGVGMSVKIIDLVGAKTPGIVGHVSEHAPLQTG